MDLAKIKFRFKNITNDFIINKQITHLSNSDFNKGTYRITKPGIYKLTEDIVLSPRKDNEYFPDLTESEYPSTPGPYILGFFAGITIETNNVVLDLNGKNIKQSTEFYLLQRFFSLIELANSPFIKKQGPGNFGPDIISGNNVWIKNGSLGLTSHHGIHGNNSNTVLIDNVTINDFEVAGIALNGGENHYLSNIVIENSIGTHIKVPINGRFSSAIYLWRTINRIINNNYPDYQLPINYLEYDLKKAKTFLDDQVLGILSFLREKDLTELIVLPESYRNYFGNPSGIPDCSAVYGILINKIGVAINDFGSCNKNCENITYTKNIFLHNIKINNFILNPLEVVGYLNNDNKYLTDFSGNLIMSTQSPFYKDEHKYYDGPFFHENKYDQILLIQLLLQMYSETHKVRWAKGVANIDEEFKKYILEGNMPLNRKTSRNTDIMGHVMKGCIGIRLDYTENCLVKKVNITNLNNIGKNGIFTSKLGIYNNQHLNHPNNLYFMDGYRGNQCHGITIINSRKTTIQQCELTNIQSRTGNCYGIDCLNNNKTCQINNNRISNIIGNLDKINNNMGQSKAIGICIRNNNVNCSGVDNEIKNIMCEGEKNCFNIMSDISNFSFNLKNQLNN